MINFIDIEWNINMNEIKVDGVINNFIMLLKWFCKGWNNL